jgi:hypothetical protein
MKLDTFIAQSLLGIVEGVRQAQLDTKESGAIIAPDFDTAGDNPGAMPIRKANGFVYAYEVEFDIAVAAGAERGAEASAGISV